MSKRKEPVDYWREVEERLAESLGVDLSDAKAAEQPLPDSWLESVSATAEGHWRQLCEATGWNPGASPYHRPTRQMLLGYCEQMMFPPEGSLQRSLPPIKQAWDYFAAEKLLILLGNEPEPTEAERVGRMVENVVGPKISQYRAYKAIAYLLWPLQTPGVGRGPNSRSRFGERRRIS